MDWDYVKRLRDLTSMKVVLKGVVTREDAALAVEHGIDAVYVSNHGGRSEESGRGALDSLPEVAEAVAGRIPVLVDSGFRRGTDMFKALALGATAVGIGRPYVWGLAAFGEEGVAAVIRMLKAELVMAMQTCGTPRLRDIGRDRVRLAGLISVAGPGPGLVVPGPEPGRAARRATRAAGTRRASPPAARPRPRRR